MLGKSILRLLGINDDYRHFARKGSTPNKYQPHIGKKEERKFNNISGKFRKAQ